MRILFIWHAAVEPEYRKLFKELSKEVGSLLVITPKSWTEGGKLQFFQEKKEIDFNYDIVPLSAIFRDKLRGHFYPNFIKIMSLIKKFQPDILHLFEEPSSFVCTELISILKIFSPNTKIILESFENLNVPQRYLYYYIQKFNLNNTDMLLTVPEEGKMLWKNRGYKNIISKINVGIDERFFFKNNNSINLKNLEFLNIRENIRICYIGRVVYEKGLHLLVNSFSMLLKNEGVDADLLIVGNGNSDYINDLKNIANQFGVTDKIFFIDSVDSNYLVSIYSKCDILVLPSITTTKWKEQFGRVLIEAMACEVAVIGSSSGEIPNVIGDAGLIFKEGDGYDLYQKLKTLVINNNLRNELISKGKKMVENMYTWTAVAKQLKKYYSEIISN